MDPRADRSRKHLGLYKTGFSFSFIIVMMKEKSRDMLKKKIIFSSGLLLLLSGCLGGQSGVKGVESLYDNAMNIKDAHTMNSTQAQDLEMKLNQMMAELGKFIGMSPQTLFSSGPSSTTGGQQLPQSAVQISQAISSAATMLVGASSGLVVDNDVMRSMGNRILGVSLSMPGNYGIRNTWNMIQFDLVGEFIAIQASYLSLVPQYMLQIMPYLSKHDMTIMAKKVEAALKQLQQAIPT